MNDVIQFDHVQGERAERKWERPVSFTVPRGALHLIRTSSTWSAPLLRLCLGFSEPNGGRVLVLGQEPGTLGRHAVRDFRRGMGCMLEPDGLVANQTLRMNLTVPLVFASGLTREEAAERTDQILDIMHLTMWEHSRPASMPLDVRQTAALARALSSRPSLVLLENPLASVATRETRRLLSLCRAQCESLLIATHRKDGILHEFADAVWEWDDDGFRVAA